VLPLESSHLPHPLLVSRSGAVAQLPCAHVGARARGGGAPPLPRSRSLSESGVSSLCLTPSASAPSLPSPHRHTTRAARLPLPGARAGGPAPPDPESLAPAPGVSSPPPPRFGWGDPRGTEASIAAGGYRCPAPVPLLRPRRTRHDRAGDPQELPGRRPRLRMCLIASLGPVYVLACVDCFVAAA
jgi:hypothetical protein